MPIFEKPFLVSVLNEVEDLDEDQVEDHYDLDDDGDGQTDELEIRLGLDPRDRFDHAHTGMVTTLDFDYLENEQYEEITGGWKSVAHRYGFILTSTDRNVHCIRSLRMRMVVWEKNLPKSLEISIVEKLCLPGLCQKRAGNGRGADEMDPGISGIGPTGNLTGSGSTGGRLAYLLDGEILDGR